MSLRPEGRLRGAAGVCDAHRVECAIRRCCRSSRSNQCLRIPPCSGGAAAIFGAAITSPTIFSTTTSLAVTRIFPDPPGPPCTDGFSNRSTRSQGRRGILKPRHVRSDQMPELSRDAMPERLARRPQFRGFPVPYTTLTRADGTPDFKVTDESEREECLRRRLCALCGEKLDYWIAFIGAEALIELREFYDPAMHQECARYAARACPFLANSEASYASPDYAPGEVSHTHYVPSSERPKRMGLYVTRSYQVVTRRISATEIVRIVRAGKPKSIDWAAMPEIV